MSKHFYFIDPNGSFSSEDGTLRYSLEKGKKAYEKLKKANAEKIRFMRFQDGEDEILIEMQRDNCKQYRQYENREQYLIELELEYKPIVLSLDNEFEVDGEEVVYHDVIASEYNLEEEVFRREELSILRKSLSALNKEEMKIIYDLFLADEPMTEREYARKNGIPQKTMNNRKKAILRKLKVFLEKVGSN